MTDKYTLTLETQIKQARKVKRLEAHNSIMRSALQHIRDEYWNDLPAEAIERIDRAIKGQKQ